MKRFQRFTGVLCLAGLAMVSGCAGGDSDDELNFLSVFGKSRIFLREFETKEVAVRYVHNEGYPLQGETIRFAIEGDGKGAIIETLITRTDAQGVARISLKGGYEAKFNVRATVEDATTIRIPISVSDDNGGILEVEIFARAAVQETDVKVILTDQAGFSCSSFDPLQPPPPSAEAAQPEQFARISQRGTTVVFSGLEATRRYAVVAIANNTVAQACRDALTLSVQQVEEYSPLTASMFLGDFLSDYTGNAFVIETQFQKPLRLGRVASLFHDMSDSPTDPIDWIIDRALIREAGDLWVAALASLARSHLHSFIANNYSGRSSALTARAKLQRVAQALFNINNVRLFTTLKIDDEALDQQSGELTAIHEFKYLSAVVNGREDRYYLKAGESLFGTPIPTSTPLAAARVQFRDAGHMRIENHTLVLPLADAIMDTVLIETLSEESLEAIFSQMIECSAVGNLGAQAYRAFDPASVVIASTIQVSLNVACQAVLADLMKDIYDEVQADLDSAGLSGEIDFEGSAEPVLLNDSKTVTRLRSGRWIGIGSFTGDRL